MFAQAGITRSYAGNSISSFLRKPHSVFQVAVPIYICADGIRGFPFLHILTNTCYLCSFDDDHSNRREVMSHCGFDLCFLDD